MTSSNEPGLFSGFLSTFWFDKVASPSKVLDHRPFDSEAETLETSS